MGTITPVFNSNSIVKDLFTPVEKSSGNNPFPKIKIEGLYCFGGIDENGARGKLSVMKIGQGGGDPIFVVPKTKGEQPKPRFGHTSAFLPSRSFFVVVGGKNNEIDMLTENLYINVLNLVNMEWIRVSTFGEKIPNLAFHSATYTQDLIFIFGGIDKNNYRGNHIYVLDFNLKKIASKLTKDDKNMSMIGKKKNFFKQFLVGNRNKKAAFGD